MGIGISIRKLLEGGKTVILPGFGRLTVKEKAEAFPVSSGYMDPPGKRVAFDGSFSKDDGGLAACWAEDGQLEREEADQQVLELVDAIRFALDKGEVYPLSDAGTFRRDDDGKIHFTPDKDWILDPDQYGLEFIELLELDDFPIESGEKAMREEIPASSTPDTEEVEEVQLVEEELVQEKLVQEETVQEEAADQPPPAFVYAPSQEDEYGDSPHRRTRAWKLVWAVAALLIVVLVILILIPTDRLGIIKDRDEQEMLHEGTPGQEEIFVPEEATTTEPPREAESTGDVENRNEQEAEHKYFLIAGSFSKLVNASELQDDLNARGYHSQVLVTEGRMYRVSVASYADKDEAIRELSAIQRASGLGSVWLLSNE